ncbi:uncharacterized protein zgc:193593 [Thalassophryne amazonica]|uniref:uncharacterized protein zgc:193593 n=1 Tax=Thalassophryne amazonica TaxID=390379 RepID=UPI00147105F8|nr:uncharacterized protein zgc:193593 [Thalassophryne amazonica]
MEIVAQLFQCTNTVTGMRKVSKHSHLFKDSTAATARRHFVLSLVTGDSGGLDSFLQTQALRQSQDDPVMPRVTVLLGLMGISMSGYSSRQLTLHNRPSNHLFR